MAEELTTEGSAPNRVTTRGRPDGSIRALEEDARRVDVRGQVSATRSPFEAKTITAERDTAVAPADLSELVEEQGYGAAGTSEWTPGGDGR